MQRVIPYDMLRKASSMAVCKINMDTDIRLAMTAAVREFMAENLISLTQEVT